MRKFLVFDWGGTFLKYALMNEKAEILEKGKVPSPLKTDTREHFLSVINDVIQNYRDQIEGIAVSSCGIIDSEKGIIHTVGAFPYLDEYPLKKEMEDHYLLPVSIENDGKSAALAELWKGNLKDVKDGAVVLLGTGIGGGIILDGKLRRGKHSSAGEFSSMCINLHKPKDTSSYFASLGVNGLIDKVIGFMNLDHECDGEEAFTYINEDDENALEALKEYTDDLALELFNLNIMLDLEKICIGGGISTQPKLMEFLKESIRNIPSYHPDLVQGMQLPLPAVEPCYFHNDANLIGALYHHLYERNE